MNKKDWEQIPEATREILVATFKSAGIDFLRDYVTIEEIQEDFSPWVTRHEAAMYAKCSMDTIDNWLKKGLIKGAKLAKARPGAVLIDKSSLEKFIKSKSINAIPKKKNIYPSIEGGYRVTRKAK